MWTFRKRKVSYRDHQNVTLTFHKGQVSCPDPIIGCYLISITAWFRKYVFTTICCGLARNKKRQGAFNDAI